MPLLPKRMSSFWRFAVIGTDWVEATQRRIAKGWRAAWAWKPVRRVKPAWRFVVVFGVLAALVAPIVLLLPSPLPSTSHLKAYVAQPSPSPVVDPDTVFLDWGPSQGDFDRALETAKEMTLKDEAGLVIIARFGGTDVGVLQALVRQYHFGGVLLTKTSIASPDQLTAFTSAIQGTAAEDGRDWPFFVSTDQEGGTVARLDGLVPTMPSFMASGAALDKSAVEQAFAGMGRDMYALGINVDFAPVADVTIGLSDPVIRTRSAGGDPENVGETVIAAVSGLLDAGVIPAIKHFPGHGGVTTDSHILTPVSTATLDELEHRDLVPFRDAIDAGAPMVMMSHVAVEAFGGIPASIDPLAYDYLRDELGFTGVAITDSMGMGALNPYGSPDQNVVAALQAGADLILIPVDNVAAYDAIIHAVNGGTLPRARLDEAAGRVIALMRYEASIDPAVSVEGDYVRNLTQASATVVAPLCGTPLVGTSVSISGGNANDRALLNAALATYGVTTGQRGTSIRLITTPDGSASADVVIALDGPWGLSASHATVFVGVYGRGPSSFAGLADILVNEVDANSTWPVPVPGLPYNPCPSHR
jgi:beta-N-acetylhexosaminidase